MKSLNELVQEASNLATRAKEKVDTLGLQLQKFGANLALLSNQVLTNSQNIAHIIKVLQDEGIMNAPQETPERDADLSKEGDTSA
jgi:hypothetical protein